MKPKLNKKAQELAEKLAAFPEVQELVQTSQSAIKHGQYDYIGWATRIDRLAKALSDSPEPGSNLRIMAAEALRIAGGDSRGIDAAMSSIFCVDGYDLQSTLMGI
jgi:hypothetical protein